MPEARSRMLDYASPSTRRSVVWEAARFAFADPFRGASVVMGGVGVLLFAVAVATREAAVGMLGLFWLMLCALVGAGVVILTCTAWLASFLENVSADERWSRFITFVIAVMNFPLAAACVMAGIRLADMGWIR